MFHKHNQKNPPLTIKRKLFQIQSHDNSNKNISPIGALLHTKNTIKFRSAATNTCFTAIEFRFTRVTVNGRAGVPVARSSPNGLISTVRATASHDWYTRRAFPRGNAGKSSESVEKLGKLNANCRRDDRPTLSLGGEWA